MILLTYEQTYIDCMNEYIKLVKVVHHSMNVCIESILYFTIFIVKNEFVEEMNEFRY